jgi:hypothetical protein
MRCHTPRKLESRAERLKGLLWFLLQRTPEICGIVEMRTFFQYLRNGHKDAGGRFVNFRLTKAVSCWHGKDLLLNSPCLLQMAGEAGRNRHFADGKDRTPCGPI